MWRVLAALLLTSCTYSMSTSPTVFVDEELEGVTREGASWWAPTLDFELEPVTHAEAEARANDNAVDTITIIATDNIRATCPWATPKADAPLVLAGITHTAANRGAVICIDRNLRPGDPRVPAHELGHAMGLHHEDNPSDLMYRQGLASSVQCEDWWQLAAVTLHAPPARCR